jgi:hypothetical protein
MAGWIRFVKSSDPSLWHLQTDREADPLCGWKGEIHPAVVDQVTLDYFSSPDFSSPWVPIRKCEECRGVLYDIWRSEFDPPADSDEHEEEDVDGPGPNVPLGLPPEVPVSTEDQGIKSTLSELLLGEPGMVDRVTALESRVAALESRPGLVGRLAPDREHALEKRVDAVYYRVSALWSELRELQRSVSDRDDDPNADTRFDGYSW